MSLGNDTGEKGFNLGKLPVEIICQIFSHLTFCEKKKASVCCKQWRCIFLETGFLKEASIKANNNLFTSRPVSSQSSQFNIQNKPPQHRANSLIAVSSYSSSSLSGLKFCLFNNVVNLEFEKDSADVSLFIKNIG